MPLAVEFMVCEHKDADTRIASVRAAKCRPLDTVGRRWAEGRTIAKQRARCSGGMKRDQGAAEAALDLATRCPRERS